MSFSFLEWRVHGAKEPMAAEAGGGTAQANAPSNGLG